MKIKNFTITKPLKIVVGLIAIISGTILQILDWGTGDSSFGGGSYFYVSFVLSGFGAFLLIDLYYDEPKKSSNFIIIYPILISLILNIYSYGYIKPNIEKEGEITNAVVISVDNLSFGDGGHKRGVFYYYFADRKKYTKSHYSENLKIGDTIKVIYHPSNPNFHLAEIGE